MNHTKGPWLRDGSHIYAPDTECIAQVFNPGRKESDYPLEANARLIAAAPTQHEEMLRFLPIIERAEADPELWSRLTAGTGIATANGYRAAIAKATQP